VKQEYARLGCRACHAAGGEEHESRLCVQIGCLASGTALILDAAMQRTRRGAG